jgi:hypothetical protein
MAKQLYERSSRSYRFADLATDLRAEFTARAEDSLLPDLESSAIACCETRSKRLFRNGLLSRMTGTAIKDTETLSVMVLTKQHLLVLVRGEKHGTTVMSAPLRDMTMGGHPRLPQAARDSIIDTGFSVWARWSRFPEGGSYHISVGDDPAGNEFRDALRQAIRDANAN